jgi:plastocyanin
MSGAARLRLGRLLPACLAAVALAGVGAGGTAAAGDTAAATPKTARVTVNDFYFGPAAVTVRRGGTVKWVWSAANSYPHDVHLKRGPKGLRKRGSYSTRTTAITEAHFQKKFTTAGTYRFICTIHPTQMHLTVTVRK